MIVRWQRWGDAISLVLWFGLSGFQPRVGYTRDILRTAVDLGTWTAFGPTAPWMLAGVACVFPCGVVFGISTTTVTRDRLCATGALASPVLFCVSFVEALQSRPRFDLR